MRCSESRMGKPLAPAGRPRHTPGMKAIPIRARWARWTVLLFLAGWVPTATAFFAFRRAWVGPRQFGRWADDLISLTVVLGLFSPLVGVLADGLFTLAGRAPEADQPDPQAADYDDRPPSTG